MPYQSTQYLNIARNNVSYLTVIYYTTQYNTVPLSALSHPSTYHNTKQYYTITPRNIRQYYIILQ